MAHVAARKKAERGEHRDADKAANKSTEKQPAPTSNRTSKEYNPFFYSAEEENSAPTIPTPNSSALNESSADNTVKAILLKAESLLTLVKATKPVGGSGSSSSSSSAAAAVNSSTPLVLPSELRGRGRIRFGLSGLPGHRGRLGFGLSGLPGQSTWSLSAPAEGEGGIRGGNGAAGGIGSFTTTTADATYDLTQIEWLLRGLPDAYETEPEYSDEAIQSIIKQGGNPPSALLFPSIYSATQRIMDKLAGCKTLRVSIQHLLVFSARFGLRRDSSHFILRPPLGALTSSSSSNSGSNSGSSSSSSSSNTGKSSSVEPSSHFIPLPELDDEVLQPIYSDTAVRRKANKGLQRDYFVGGIDMQHVQCIPLCLTDNVVREWMEGGKDGCIQLALYGYLFPPSTTTKGHAFSDPVVFGTATIPLSGLLLSDSLDAIVTADLDVDQSTLATVLGRARALPQGHALLGAKPLGLKMGTVKMQLTLLGAGKTPEAELEALTAAQSTAAAVRCKINKTGDANAESKKSPLLQPFVSPAVQQERMQGVRPHSDPLHAAMHYHPQEARSCAVDPSAAAPDATPASIAVGVYSVDDIYLNLPPHTTGSLSVRFKMPAPSSSAPAPNVTISMPLRLSQQAQFNSLASPCSVVSTIIPTLKVFDIRDLRAFKTPIFEVWMELDGGAQGEKTGQGQRILVGLAHVPETARLNEISRVKIVDVLQRSDDCPDSVGYLVVSLSAHMSRGAVEDMGNKLLSWFTAGGMQSENIAAYGMDGVDNISAGGRSDLPPPRAPPVVAPIDTATGDAVANMDTDLSGDMADLGSQDGSLRSLIEGEDQVQLGDNVLRIVGEDEGSGDDDRGNDKDELANVIALLNPMHPSPPPPSETRLERIVSALQVPSPARQNAQPEARSVTTSTISTALAFPYTHILEVSIEGSCANIDSMDAAASAAPLGCYLVYRLDSPFLHLVEESSSSDSRMAAAELGTGLAGALVGDRPSAQSRWSSVWWDGDCAVLNGRARHVFELRGGADSTGPCFPLGLQMYVVQCDVEGNLPQDANKNGEEGPPVPTSSILGVATVSSAVLEELLSQAGGREVFDVRWDPVVHSTDGGADATHGIEKTVSVSLSHHVDPLLVRSSFGVTGAGVKLGATAFAGPTGATADLTGAGGRVSELASQSVTNTHAAITASASRSSTSVSEAGATTAHASKGRTIDIAVTIDTLFVRTAISGSTHFAGAEDASDEPDSTPFSVYLTCSAVSSKAVEPSSMLSSVVGSECFVSALRPLRAPGKVQWDGRHTVSVPCSTGAIGAGDNTDSTQPPVFQQRALRGAALQFSVFYRKSWRASLPSLSNISSSVALNSPAGSAGDGVQIGDYLLGNCIMDLSAMSYTDATATVEGWYHVLDGTNKEVGQISLLAALDAAAIAQLTPAAVTAHPMPAAAYIVTLGETDVAQQVPLTERSRESQPREELAADAASSDRSSVLDYSTSFADGVYFLDRTTDSAQSGPSQGDDPESLASQVSQASEGPFQLDITAAAEEGEDALENGDKENEDTGVEEERESVAVAPPISPAESWLTFEGEDVESVATPPPLTIDVTYNIAHDSIVTSTSTTPTLTAPMEGPSTLEYSDDDDDGNGVGVGDEDDDDDRKEENREDDKDVKDEEDEDAEGWISVCNVAHPAGVVSSATLMGYIDGEDEWSADEEDQDKSPHYQDASSDTSKSSEEVDGGSPPRLRAEQPSLKAASTVSGLFASLIGGILQTDAVRSNPMLAQTLARGPTGEEYSSDVDEDDWEEQVELGEPYPNDFLSYQGTDTDLGSVYTLDFEVGSLEALEGVEGEEQDSDEDGWVDARQMWDDADSSAVRMEAGESVMAAPAAATDPAGSASPATLAPTNAAGGKTAAPWTPVTTNSTTQADSGASSASASASMPPVFVPTFWKKDGDEGGSVEPPLSSSHDFALSPTSALPAATVTAIATAATVPTPATPTAAASADPDSPLTSKVFSSLSPILLDFFS